MMGQDYDDYIAENLVAGWFQDADARMFGHILAAQLDDHISGDLLEIGCYMGKSAIAMGYGLRGTDRLHVCDLFDTRPEGISTEGLEPYQGLTEQRFLDNWFTWHNRRPELHKCSSTELESRLHTRFRFIHVDGSHAYSSVRHDLHLAASHAAIDGVLVFDDFRTSHTPGVSAAVWEAAATGWIFPFALTETKLYATATKASQALWYDIANQFDLPYEEHLIHGLKVLRHV